MRVVTSLIGRRGARPCRQILFAEEASAELGGCQNGDLLDRHAAHVDRPWSDARPVLPDAADQPGRTEWPSPHP